MNSFVVIRRCAFIRIFVYLYTKNRPVWRHLSQRRLTGGYREVYPSQNLGVDQYLKSKKI
jgi:hypothetical protein